MSGFSETIMHERLKRLTNTLNSIQTLSLWLIHHQKRHEGVILTTWLKEVKENNDPERLMSLMNLANDVIQNSRKKYPGLKTAFLPVLKPALTHIHQIDDDRVRRTILRVLDVWRDRSIYSSEQLKVLKSCLRKEGADVDAEDEPLSSPIIDTLSPTTPSPSATPTKREAEEGAESGEAAMKAISSPPEEKRPRYDSKAFFTTSTELVERLKKLEEPASADAKVRQLIASYPAQIANPSLLIEIKSSEQAQQLMNRINEASPIVTAYCERLKAEVEDRQAIQRLTSDYLESLNATAEGHKSLVGEVRKRIAQIDEEQKEMERHIESLPDLEELFGQNTGANTQLPSLGDLFKNDNPI